MPGPVRVRRARDADLVGVGELTVAAYAEFTAGPDDPYVAQLRDAARRAREAELWVAEDDDGLLGSVTGCPPGSPWREVAGADEGELRMLAVDPGARRRGAARALVDRVEQRSREHGARAVALSSLAEMTGAHALYRSLGYARAPDRDWSPHPGTELVVFTRTLDADPQEDA